MPTPPSTTADPACTPPRRPASRRLTRMLVFLCILTGGMYAAAPGAYAQFALGKLFLDSKTGSENYLFTSGNTVFAQGTIDAADTKAPGRSYQFTFSDASGATRSISACTPTGAVNNAAVWASYTLTSSDPPSTSTNWRVVLRQYTDSRCATLEKTSTAVGFQVAQLTAYANSSLTTPIGIVGPQATGYVRVAGVGQGQTLWNPTWLARGGAAACANTLGTDRTASDANGIVPSGTGAYLQYPPGTTGAAWNLARNYDAACAAFSSGNDGAWSLALRRDATHFVTLPAFSVDATPAASSSSSPASARSTGITVSYTASDGTGAGLAGVDLYAKGPADIGYAKVATDSKPGASGSFAFTATKGDGRYSFYTVATDKLGNVEAAPSTADSSTAVDTVPPSSSGNSPQYSTSNRFQVTYAASDLGTGASGLATVDLYVRRPGDAASTKVAGTTSPGSSGTLAYTADAGDGPYAFYTVATDAAGNTEAAPSSPDTSTLVDTATPASQASSPASTTSRNLQVTYTASDAGSGLAKLDLYAEGPDDTDFSKVATDSTPTASGSFPYHIDGQSGSYRFYTRATDNAGNVQPAPATADTTTVATVNDDIKAP